ncbi:MAG: hypothetical protein K0S86_547 [Geminicoccaceae bacterium]|nr:hypothetical protein [Geminicoccaceae bacterium]
MWHGTRTSTAVFAATLMLFGCSDGSRATTEPAPADSTGTIYFPEAAHETRVTRNDVRIVKATGDITAAVDEFRTLLGALNPNVNDEQPGGRREINWDGVPAALTNNELFPGNFFNVNSPRGVLFTTDGPGFRISSNGYVDVNPTYNGEFNVFSPAKLFVAVGSTVTDVAFVVAGSNVPARVTGFGAVFADVGRAHSTTIEYFDAAGNHLLTLAAPRRSDETGLSFVGAVFDSGIVTRVRIRSGDTPLGATVEDNVKGAGRKRDLAAMDDFIYGEPRASR